MPHFIVSCECQGKRRNTVEVPVEAATPMLAAEKGERLASDSFGYTVYDWFAWKVEPDTE